MFPEAWWLKLNITFGQSPFCIGNTDKSIPTCYMLNTYFSVYPKMVFVLLTTLAVLMCADQLIHHVPRFLLSQLLLATGKLLISAEIEVHTVLRIFQFIKSIFSSNPVSKNTCIPSPFHVVCKFNKCTLYSIIHSVNKNAGKIRDWFRINLQVELLVTSSILMGSLYKYSLNVAVLSSWCFYFAPS